MDYVGKISMLLTVSALAVSGCANGAEAQVRLTVPERVAGAMSGTQFHDALTSKTRDEREAMVYREVLAGNVPEFLRTLQPVTVSVDVRGTTRTAVFYATAEPIGVGEDADYYLMPTTPILGQWIADALNCTMPTRKMSDAIWQAATCRLDPQPIPPDRLMALEPRFWEHQALVVSARAEMLTTQPLGALVAGDKKDVVVTMRLQETHHKSPRVFIYGWHRANGKAIQPLSAAHEDTYVDYSHGTRLVSNTMWVDGVTTTVQAVLKDPDLHVLLSDEGPYENVGLRYPVSPAPQQ